MLQRINSLDGARGLAVLMVMTSHLMFIEGYENYSLWKFLKNGWMGVDLFFVLSGFLITTILILSKEKSNYFKNFIMRRTLRIFPLYYFVLIIVWLGITFFSQDDHGQNLIWYFTYTSNIGMAIQDGWLNVGGYLGLSHFWSLAVEEQFYIFWPLIVYLLPRRILSILCLAMLLAGPSLRELIGLWMHSESMASYVMTPARMDSLAAGALLASLYQNNLHFHSLSAWNVLKYLFSFVGISFMIIGQISGNHSWIFYSLMLLSIAAWVDLDNKWLAWLAFLMAGFCGIQTIYQYAGAYSYTINILFFTNLIHVIQKHRIRVTSIIFENPIILNLGKYSYALYIFHHLLQHQWKWITKDLMHLDHLHPLLFQLLFILISGGLTYVIARITWVFLEQPFQNLKTKFEFK
jgi:peptidoglycan/LPS O-acetylase OafA/YrhL